MARTLLDEHATAGGASEVPVALERACATLHARLAPWIGGNGSKQLLGRALTFAAANHPILSGARIGDGASAHIEGLEALAEEPAESARAAAEAFLGAAFEQLARLVGDPVAVRLVSPQTPDLWNAPPDGDDR